MKFTYLIIFIFFITSFVKGQSTIDASGGELTGSGGNASYSVGQIDYINYNNANGLISEGVQQPYELITIGIKKNTEDDLTITIYPNPTPESISLKIVNNDLSDFYFELFDLNGKLLQSQKIQNEVTSIVMVNFSAACYFLKINKDKEAIKTFKIIKH